MRLTTAVASALLSTAALVGHVHADEPASEAPSTTIDAPKPNFTPTKLKAPFLEQFTDDWEKRWTPSHAKKEDSSSEEDWAYVGNWAVEEPTVFGGIKGDKGLVVKNAAAHHAISAKFPKPIDNKGKPLVVQYEVKLQDMLSCGGAYMKLLRENKALHAEEFSNTTPYVIMFGPDRCGVTNKVHFIFKLKKQNSDEYQEHHMRLPPQVRVTKLSTLYTLVLNPDDSFKVLIDGEEVKNGTLFTEFTPAVIPMEEIDDPTDVKPEDWVDIMKIPDPDATKPDDWDENAPFEIPDEEATKPEDWLDDEPLTIPDPEAEKPEDWDDEEDGDWTAPSVPNPKCNEVSGCGPWEQPMKTNPDYKGPWNPPMIDNPEYKGPWSPRTIANPDYYDVPSPLVLDAMGAIGFEIWTMQSDILFDNIYIGNSLEDANALKAETFDIKRPIEAAQEEASKPKPEPAADEEIVSFKEDPVKHIRAKVDRFIALAQKSPIEAAKAVPDVAGALGALLVTLVLVIVGAVGSSTPAPAVVKKEAGKAKEAAEDAAKAVSTGAEKAKAEVTKRVTRSG